MKEKNKKETQGKLFIVGTPIGNLGDFTLRARETLELVDYILAEDTRVTQKLCTHFHISKKIIRCDEYARESLYEKVCADLTAGLSVAFVSDAGTPGIADPAARLVSFVSSHVLENCIIPIPGVSAVSTILSVSGVHANQFIFLGYPPHKKGRETFFRTAAAFSIRPLVFFESPHRYKKTLDALEKFFGGDTKIVVGREVTKLYEEIFRGTISSAKEFFTPEHVRGEFVLVIV